jgi:hypothetical protein
VGWQLGSTIIVASAGFMGSRPSRPLKMLISNPLDSRELVAPTLIERVSRPLVSSRTLRGSGFFEP